MSKKVLIAIPRFKVGGAETQAFYLARELQERGFRVLVGAFGFEKSEGFLRFEQAGIKCIRWEFHEKIILNPAKGISGWIRKYRYVIKLSIQVRALNYDCIIPFTYPSNVIFCRWYNWMKVKKCFWNQRDEGRMFGGSKSEIKSLNGVSHIISNSLEGMNFLKQFTEKRILHIPNGIELGAFNLTKTNYKSKKVIMIGNIHGYKDHLTLIKAWKLVLAEFPDFRLVLAGKKGNRFQDCDKLVQKLGIENSVDFLGLVENVPNLLKKCCMAVFSSDNEGVPNGVLESMAAALPIVATNIQGTREALGENYEFLVEPRNAVQFAGKIIQMLGNQQLREKIGRKNLSKVSSDFSMKVMVDQFEELLNA